MFPYGWHLDWISFSLGLISGLIIFIILDRIFPSKADIKNFFWNVLDKLSAIFSPNVELQIRKDLIQYSLKSHLASPLFPLEEILIEPSLLALPPQYDNQPALFDGESDTIIPSLPDFPEFASTYFLQSFHLIESLPNHPNLLLMGKLGSGKTTALLDLTLRLCRSENSNQAQKSIIPLYIHASQILSDLGKEYDPLDTLIEGIKPILSKRIMRNLHKSIHNLALQNRLMILLDGIDELSPDNADKIIHLVETFHQKYPDLQLIISSSVNYIGSLNQLGFIPIWIKSWNKADIHTFLEKWRNAWLKAFPNLEKEQQETYILKNAWLSQVFHSLTPLEWVLASWLMYRGNFINSSPTSILEKGCELTNDTHHSFDELGQIFLGQLQDIHSNLYSDKPADSVSSPVQNNPSDQFDKLITSIHPLLKCYCAAQAIQPNSQEFQSLVDPKWTMRWQTITFALARSENLANSLKIENNQLYVWQLTQSSALKYIVPNSEYAKKILRECAQIINNPNLPLNLRSKFISNLVTSSLPEVQSFITFLLKSKDPSLLQLGALGFGLLHPSPPIEPLLPLIENQNPNIYTIACKALAVNENPKSLDYLTDILVNAPEQLRIAAANALASHVEQGHSILREAINQTDPLIRKACVYGLVKINQPWCYPILEKIAIEDNHWMVKNVAISALEYLNHPKPWIPKPFPDLKNQEWLIQFSTSQGIDFLSVNDVNEIILMAIKQGNLVQQLKAIEVIRYYPFREAIPLLFSAMASAQPELKSELYLTLWFISISN